MGFIADELLTSVADDAQSSQDNCMTFETHALVHESMGDKIDKITAHIQSMEGRSPAHLHIGHKPEKVAVSDFLENLVTNATGGFTADKGPIVPQWETLTCSPQLGEQTDRMLIERGWLYRTKIGNSIALAFVPDPSR